MEADDAVSETLRTALAGENGVGLTIAWWGIVATAAGTLFGGIGGFLG